MDYRLIWNTYALLVVPLLVWGFFYLKRIFYSVSKPTFFFSDLKVLSYKKIGLRQKLAPLPDFLFSLGWVLLVLALFNPKLIGPKGVEQPTVEAKGYEPVSTKGIAIYLLLDQSGSMKRDVTTWSEEKGKQVLPKADLLKEVTKEFIQERSNDLIGLVTFARTATIVSPLTLDHKSLINKLDAFQPVEDPTQDGTGMGYGIFKTVNTIVSTRHYGEELAKEGRPSYSMESHVILLVTDGFQGFNPLDEGSWLRTLDVEEAASYARDNNVKVYIVNIEPSLVREEFLEQRNKMQRAAEMTGGKFYLASTVNGLDEIYGEINNLEKSSLPSQAVVAPTTVNGIEPHEEIKIRFLPYLLIFGMGALAIAVILSTTYLARVP